MSSETLCSEWHTQSAYSSDTLSTCTYAVVEQKTSFTDNCKNVLHIRRQPILLSFAKFKSLEKYALYCTRYSCTVSMLLIIIILGSACYAAYSLSFVATIPPLTISVDYSARLIWCDSVGSPRLTPPKTRVPKNTYPVRTEHAHSFQQSCTCSNNCTAVAGDRA